MNDGIALKNTQHPEGDPVPDDHEIKPDSLETVEINLPVMPEDQLETVCALLRQAHDVLSLSSLPPTKPWVGLSDAEVAIYSNVFNGVRLVREIEAQLKERNNG